MNIMSLIRLPMRLKNVVRSMRRDLAETRQIAAETQHVAAETRQVAAESRQVATEIVQLLSALRSEELVSLRETIRGEIREQGLLMEAAARLATRAKAELKLRNRLARPPARKRGVSVLITCWNHAGYLSRAVESARGSLDLLPVPGEVLILDDASRDGSRALAQEWANTDDRIVLIASDENLGLPRARNVLLEQARFEHAMILDSDNELVPSGIPLLYTAARQTGAVLAYGNLLKVDESGSVTAVISNERPGARLLKENWIDAMALVRTERLIELGGYDSHWLYGMEDWELNQRLLALGEPMVFVPVLVGRYSTLPHSMIHEAPLSARYRRGSRIFGSVGELRSTEFRACVYHPDLGPIWASAGWSSPVAAHGARAVPRRCRSRASVLVVTSGGVQNYGDDAILLSTLQRLRRIRPDWSPTVVSDGSSCPPLGRLGAWAGTCKEFSSGLDARDVGAGCQGDGILAAELARRIDFGSHPATSLKSFDLLVFAGGGNLNVHWPELIAWRTAIAAAARAAGVPYFLTGQGVGPIAGEIIPMLSFLAGEASAVGTRDSLSLDLLREIVPYREGMKLVGDDALGLKVAEPAVARAYLAEIGVPIDRPLLGFHAREAPYVGFSRDELRETARKVDEFAAEHGYVVMGLPINMQPAAAEAELLTDLAYGAARRARWHVVNCAGDIAALAGVIKILTAVLTHSYHVGIFALESRIPTLLFASTEYYRLKGEALRTAFGIPVSITADRDVAAAAIAKQLETISQASWSQGMTSADVDRWLDGALPRGAGWPGALSLSNLERPALGRAG
jgi:polysaccharide pyruvyl transferase WcaK-like protein